MSALPLAGSDGKFPLWIVDNPEQILVRRTKRLWMDEEKRSICFQTAAPGVSVAQVARRYAVNANMVFKRLRDLH